MSEHAEEQEEPCSVEAEEANERIAARRLRIAARNKTKASLSRKDVDEEEEEEEEEEDGLEMKEGKRKSQQQVERSERMLINLLSDGTQLITNIQVSSDAKESQRRTELREARRLQVEKLESEARSSMQKCEEITRGWSQAKAKLLPQDLHQALRSQQQLCVQLLEDKNTLINDLQQELKARDDRYVKQLKRQAEEVDLMIQRMEEQVKGLLRTNRQELDTIEKAYEEEREVLLTGNRQQWEQHLKHMSTKEVENMVRRRTKVEEYEVMLERLRLVEIEDYNVTKEKLETDVQTTQRWRQQQKATAQLNLEKQEFNIHVLTHREKDSMLIQSKLKRKINRLHDLLNSLKAKQVHQTEQAAEETRSQCEAYTHAMQQYRHTQKKTRHFAAVDGERFAEVWRMREAEVRALAARALDIDRLLHEQQLGVAWERPPPAPPKLLPPLPRGHASAGPSSGMPRSDRPSSGGKSGAASAPAEGDAGTLPAPTVERLLQLLCDEAGFLMESKLLLLLSPLDTDQSLIRLGSIFCSLGIESEEDIRRLAEFFTNYQQRQNEVDGEESPSGPAGLIHPDRVLAALKAFTEQYRRPREPQSAPHHHSPKEAEFWESLANTLPESKLKTWAALDSALEKYHAVLTERAQLFRDTQALKQQNAELRMLLHRSVSSKVNSELEAPPTQIMMAPK